MIGGIWTRDTVGWFLLAAAVPVAVEFGIEQGVPGLGRLGLALVIIASWQAIFRATLGVPICPASGIAALGLAVLAPPEAGLVQFAVAMSFGIVAGELIFGGWGRNFLNAGIVALAFLSLSLPNAELATAGSTMALAVVPGAALLLFAGILSLPVMLGFGIGLGAAATAGGSVTIADAGSLAFIAVFMLGDPVAAAATRTGRWLYGFLAGVLCALMATTAPTTNAAIFAVLLASLFAPLIDQAVIAARAYRRTSRHG